MGLRSKVCRALLMGAACAVVPLSCAAQAASAGSSLPGPSRLDVYGGYAHFHPISSSLDGYAYEPIGMGGVVSATGYLGNHLGVQMEGQFSPHGPDDCFYTAQAGPVYRMQMGRLTPFAHALFGGARVGGPGVQPCTWGYGATAGVGLDYILPYVWLRNRVAIRVIQADYEYAHADFGVNTAPTFVNGGVAQIDAYRLSAGLVIRLGEKSTAYAASLGCEVQPVQVYPGDPISVTSRVINLEANKKVGPTYTWSTSGGKITSTGEAAQINTAGLAPGDYAVSGHVSEGSRASEHADCSASFRVAGYEPPTLACSANPSSILPGGFSTITAVGRSPQNRTLNYSYGTSAGEITGMGTTGTLTAADVSPGVISVTCNVVDDLGLAAKAETTVTVVAPAAPPAPTARALCSVSFERDRKRPVRVDNEAKGCLDDIALELNREADALLVIVGKHDPEEKPDAAAERTLNIKQYLTEEKGIDASRIEVRTGESTGRSADNVLVPPGATWDPGGTTSFDPARVKRSGEPYAPGPLR
jgi:hypothetical protein